MAPPRHLPVLLDPLLEEPVLVVGGMLHARQGQVGVDQGVVGLEKAVPAQDALVEGVGEDGEAEDALEWGIWWWCAVVVWV